MSLEIELDDLTNKSRASSSQLDASIDPGSVTPGTYPENFRENTSASWAWAASGMFVATSGYHFDEHSDDLDPGCYHGRVPFYSAPASSYSPLASPDKE